MKKMMADLAVFSPLPTGCSTENDKNEHVSSGQTASVPGTEGADDRCW